MRIYISNLNYSVLPKLSPNEMTLNPTNRGSKTHSMRKKNYLKNDHVYVTYPALKLSDSHTLPCTFHTKKHTLGIMPNTRDLVHAAHTPQAFITTYSYESYA